MNPSLSRNLIAALLLCTLVTICTAAGYSEASALPSTAVAIALPVPTPVGDSVGNYTKIDIVPSYVHFMLKPGADNEQVISVRNRDDKTISVAPVIRQNPYNGPYQLETSWISISPSRADIPAGQSAKFTVRAAIPNDTRRGSYNTQLVFTDEQYPSPYPQSSPNYVHTASLSVDVAAGPVIRVDPTYINDQLEAGNVYRYSVNITNAGSLPVILSPKVSDNGYWVYSSSGPVEPVLNASSFSIDAPSAITPNGTATMTVTVHVPPGRSGNYNGYIDLGIDDPSLQEGEGRVSLSFTVWQQPAGAFTRQFSMSSSDPITVKLTATPQSYSTPAAAQGSLVREPSFDVTLTGPSGNAAVQQTNKEIRGSVSVGMDSVIYGSGKSGEYQQVSSQYIYTFTAQGRPGTWTLAVMPKNTQTFEYSIGIGNDQDQSIFSFLQQPGFSGPRGTNLE